MTITSGQKREPTEAMSNETHKACGTENHLKPPTHRRNGGGRGRGTFYFRQAFPSSAWLLAAVLIIWNVMVSPSGALGERYLVEMKNGRHYLMESESTGSKVRTDGTTVKEQLRGNSAPSAVDRAVESRSTEETSSSIEDDDDGTSAPKADIERSSSAKEDELGGEDYAEGTEGEYDYADIMGSSIDVAPPKSPPTTTSEDEEADQQQPPEAEADAPGVSSPAPTLLSIASIPKSTVEALSSAAGALQLQPGLFQNGAASHNGTPTANGANDTNVHYLPLLMIPVQSHAMQNLSVPSQNNGAGNRNGSSEPSHQSSENIKHSTESGDGTYQEDEERPPKDASPTAPTAPETVTTEYIVPNIQPPERQMTVRSIPVPNSTQASNDDASASEDDDDVPAKGSRLVRTEALDTASIEDSRHMASMSLSSDIGSDPQDDSDADSDPQDSDIESSDPQDRAASADSGRRSQESASTSSETSGDDDDSSSSQSDDWVTITTPEADPSDGDSSTSQTDGIDGTSTAQQDYSLEDPGLNDLSEIEADGLTATSNHSSAKNSTKHSTLVQTILKRAKSGIKAKAKKKLDNAKNELKVIKKLKEEKSADSKLESKKDKNLSNDEDNKDSKTLKPKKKTTLKPKRKKKEDDTTTTVTSSANMLEERAKEITNSIKKLVKIPAAIGNNKIAVANNLTNVSSTEVNKQARIFTPFQEDGLRKHNELRAEHGVPPLKLNLTLCNDASEYAKQLAAIDSIAHSSQAFIQYGENIFSGSINSGAAEAVQSWYDEIGVYKYFGTDPPDIKSATPTGHFTQLVWNDTTDLGMGQVGRMIVARYTPPGNILGSFGRNVPKPIK